MASPAWKTAAEIADGYTTLNTMLLKKYMPPELDALQRELEKTSRDIRAQVVSQDDIEAIQTRNRKLLRLSQALSVLQAHRVKNKV